MKFGIHSTDTAPHITSITPLAALPGGEVEVHGRRLATEAFRQPTATIGEQPSPVRMSHGSKVLLHVPDGAISGNVQLRVDGHTSNAMPLSVGVAIAEEMDPVASPVVDPEGNIYVTFSGQRGQQTPVSVFQIDPEYQVRPFATGILNATGVALDPEGNLYVSSRHEGTVYRVTPSGAKSVFAEGMGVATGLAFDRDGFSMSAIAAEPSSKFRKPARSSSSPRWNPASPPIIWPLTIVARCWSAAPPPPPTSPSTPLSRTEKSPAFTPDWAVPRAWHST